MKLKKMNRLLQGVALGVCLAPWTITYAAQQEMLWGNINDYAPLLKNFTLAQSSAIPHGLRVPMNFSQKNTLNTFQFATGNLDYAGRSHMRYNQYYEGVPVWGTQVIYHISSQNKTTVTGSVLNGIEKDVASLNAKISLDQAKQIAIGKNPVTAKVNVEKVIFFDQNISNRATLAYHVSYMSRTAEGPSLPSFIIDANTGKILQQWDALPSVEDGKGLGGVQLRKEYQFGQVRTGLNAFGSLDVTHVSASVCTMSTNLVRVYNLRNLQESQLGFRLPVSSAAESRLSPFAYYCTSPNLNDNGYAPTNGGISPINDVTFFAKQTYNMFNSLGVPSPVGGQLPVRIYTHIGSYDNAFACDASCMQGSGPQQLVFGNGATTFLPLTEGDVVAHEFGHLVTGNFSRLFYADQSGGMNEAFSDITGIAFNNYLRNKGFTWYWNGLDWNTGSSITKNGLPLRYFDEPTKDGRSISNAANFQPGMNTHYSSGVYNKAFYLLSNTPGWTLDKAYRVVLDANMYYWTPSSQFISGACGVAQAAVNRGFSSQDVKNAFLQVGVDTTSCRVIES